MTRECTAYGKHDYLAAKQFLKGAVVVRQCVSPTVTNTTYRHYGRLWQETESHLEAPEDGYRLVCVSSDVDRDEGQDRPAVTCRICEEDGPWCYVTGFGYACANCRARAREDEEREPKA